MFICTFISFQPFFFMSLLVLCCFPWLVSATCALTGMCIMSPYVQNVAFLYYKWSKLLRVLYIWRILQPVSSTICLKKTQLLIPNNYRWLIGLVINTKIKNIKVKKGKCFLLVRLFDQTGQ